MWLTTIAPIFSLLDKILLNNLFASNQEHNSNKGLRLNINLEEVIPFHLEKRSTGCFA